MKYVLSAIAWTGAVIVVTVLSFTFFKTDKVVEQVEMVEQKIDRVEKIQDQVPTSSASIKEDRIE